MRWIISGVDLISAVVGGGMLYSLLPKWSTFKMPCAKRCSRSPKTVPWSRKKGCYRYIYLVTLRPKRVTYKEQVQSTPLQSCCLAQAGIRTTIGSKRPGGENTWLCLLCCLPFKRCWPCFNQTQREVIHTDPTFSLRMRRRFLGWNCFVLTG